MNATLLQPPTGHSEADSNAFELRMHDIFTFGPDRSLIQAVDDLLEVMYTTELTVDEDSGSLRIRRIQNGIADSTAEIALRRPLLRTILARISKVGSDRSRDGHQFNPYGDTGFLPKGDGSERGASISYGNSQQTGVWLKSTPA